MGTGLVSTSTFTPTVHTHVWGEAFAGDSIETDFTLAHTPVSTVAVYVAGVRVTNWTLDGAVITFTPAPGLAAAILVDYEY